MTLQTMVIEVSCSDLSIQRKSPVAANAPASWAAMKPAVSAGRMPAKVSVAARARVTAGLANDVDDVNQYAAVM